MLSLIKRVAFVGLNASRVRAEVDLGLPPKSVLARNIIIVRDDHELHRLYGYSQTNLAIVCQTLTPRMVEFLSSGLYSITLEEAREWMGEIVRRCAIVAE